GGRTGLARGRARGCRDRQRGWRRPGETEGLHRAQERLCRRRRAARDAEGLRQGPRRSMEISALDRHPAGFAAHGDGQDSALQAARLTYWLLAGGEAVLVFGTPSAPMNTTRIFSGRRPVLRPLGASFI